MVKLTVHHLQVGQGERIPFLLEELGIPYDIRLYQRSPLLSPPDLQAKHPIGASPVLEDATFDPEHPLVLAESSAIVEYLIHKHGRGRLALPPSHPNYADYLYWFHFCNASLQPALFRRATTRPATANDEDPRFASSDARVRKAVAHVDGRLRAAPYLAGEEFTAADVMMVWCFTTMRRFEPVHLGEYPGVLAWVKRCTAREAYRRAMARCDPELDLEEGASEEGPRLHEVWAKVMARK